MLLGLWVAACGKSAAPAAVVMDDGGGGLGGVVIVERTGDGKVVREEAEPNDEDSAATLLAVPGAVTGVIDGAADVDRFAFEVSASGWVSVRLSGIEGVDLSLELLDAKGQVIAHCDNGPERVPEGFPNAPVAVGRHLLVVREFSRKPRKGQSARTGPSPPYRLEVEMVPLPGASAEQESNRDAATAKQLSPGGEVRGYIGWRGDIDVWRLPLADAELGLFDFDIRGVRGVELSARLSGERGLTRQGASGQSLAIRGWQPPAGAAAVDLVLRGRRSNFEEEYTIAVIPRMREQVGEVEPNDDTARAVDLDAVGASGSLRAVLTPGDTDAYGLRADGASLRVTVEPSGGIAVAAKLTGGDGALLAEANGSGAFRLETALPTSGRVWLTVARTPGAQPLEEDVAGSYQLQWERY